MEEKKDLLDILLDENDVSPIPMVDEKGESILFKQIAVIPYNEKIYCILKPLNGLEIAEDEAIVFYVDEEEDDLVLKVEVDEEVSISIFEEYYDMLEKNWLGGKKDD